MSMVPMFGMRQVVDKLNDFTDQCEKDIIELFQYVGEEVVNSARQHGSYKDRTGNLRSSIGYVIVIKGNIVAQSFPGKKTEGKSTAVDRAKELAGKHSTGVNLIVVAGMQYAAAVESKGYDVLSGSASKAEKLLKDLKRKVVK